MNHTIGILILGVACGLTIAAVFAAIVQVMNDRKAVKKEWEIYKKALYSLAEKVGAERKGLENT